MRKWILTGLVAGLFATLAIMSVAARFGIVAVDLQRPDTHWFWYLSRAAGISAYLALALSVVWGLLLSTGLGDTWIARGRSVELHKWISAVALALVLTHAFVLVGDPYVRFDLVAVLVPFAAEYRRLAVALGALSLYGTVVVFGSFWLRRQIGQRTWRVVHMLAFPTFGLVTLHGILAGSDSGTPWMRLVYLLGGGVVLWLATYRLIARPRAGAPAGGYAEMLPRVATQAAARWGMRVSVSDD